MKLNTGTCSISKRILFLCTFFLTALVATAQDKAVGINLNTNSTGNWYTASWVWVVGAVVFIILIAAILKRDRTTNI